MGCAPSTHRVTVQQQNVATEENNNHRISMEAPNYQNEAVKDKPQVAEIYGAEVSDGSVPGEDGEPPPVYGADLPDHNMEENTTGDDNERQEIHVPVITHSNKSVTFGNNEPDKALDGRSSSSSSSSSSSHSAEPEKLTEQQEKLTEEVLNEFIELDKEIQRLEAGHIEEKLTFHQMEYTNLEAALKISQADLATELKNVEDGIDLNCSQYMQSVSNTLLKDDDEPTRTENLQHLRAMNKIEVCEKELEALQAQLHKISETVEILLKEVDLLTSKRFKLNGLLENVFNGSYGSVLENRLELETEQLLQYKQHVSVAHFKWWNGRILINHAVTQMAVACRQWKGIQNILVSAGIETEAMKYKLATDARNNIVAAHQNCVRTGEYLKMNMPYWTMEDNQNIVASINRLYTDVLRSASFENAYAWFYYYHRRLGLQLNWMDQVINNKIVGDHKRVSKEFKSKYRELRKERLSLLQAKVKEILNIDFDIEPFLVEPEDESDDTDTLPTVGAVAPPTETSADAESDPTPSDDSTLPKPADDAVSLPKPVDEVVPGDVVPDINENADDVITTTDEAENVETIETVESVEAVEKEESKPAPPPPVRRLSLSELAPTPTDNELFGNVKQLEEAHRKQMEEFDKVQILNKAKQEQGLKEKLRERQSRRRKIQLQQIQETALSAVTTTG